MLAIRAALRQMCNQLEKRAAIWRKECSPSKLKAMHPCAAKAGREMLDEAEKDLSVWQELLKKFQ